MSVCGLVFNTPRITLLRASPIAPIVVASVAKPAERGHVIITVVEIILDILDHLLDQRPARAASVIQECEKEEDQKCPHRPVVDCTEKPAAVPSTEGTVAKENPKNYEWPSNHY